MLISIRRVILFTVVSLYGLITSAQETYAEKLGWPKGSKVIILHVDDAGMSYYSNQGAIQSIENGIATSCSIMMPCPWAASFTKHAIEKNYDAGLHLTLTSEWNDYRWPPLSGAKQVPGLVDKDWNMWPEAEDVVQHATADEVEMEIRSQLARALSMGLKPTHLDSHMGTLFASNTYLERYIKVGVENGIPVMFPGGEDQLLIECLNAPVIKKMKQEGKWKEGTVLPEPAIVKNAAAVGQTIWAAGLPVLDDLFTNSGEWKPDTKGKIDPKVYGKYKAQQFIALIKRMRPGVAMFIVHSSDITNDFKYISASGESRYADLLSMLDPELKAYIQSQGIILTTWREMMERRKKVK